MSEDDVMTYRGRLMREHPENVGGYHTGGAKGCPCDYGYENGLACERRGMKNLECRDCWDRVMKR